MKIRALGISLISLYIGLMGTQGYAQGYAQSSVDFSRDTQGRIWLSASSCGLLLKQRDAIRSWRQRIEDSFSRSSTECIPGGGEGLVRLDISNDLPPKAQEVIGIKPSVSGPNCWNSALVLSGLRNNYYFTQSGDFTQAASQYCESVSDSKPQAGDVVAIRMSSPDVSNIAEGHAFIYISSELAFTKNGTDNTVPYTLASPDEVMKTYRVDPSQCFGKQKSDTACRVYAQILRCDRSKMEKRNEIARQLVKNFDDLSEFSSSLERESLYGNPRVTASSRKSFSDLDGQIKTLLDNQKSPGASLPCSTTSLNLQTFEAVNDLASEIGSLSKQLSKVTSYEEAIDSPGLLKEGKSRIQVSFTSPDKPLEQILSISENASTILQRLNLIDPSPSISLRKWADSSRFGVSNRAQVDILLGILSGSAPLKNQDGHPLTYELDLSGFGNDPTALLLKVHDNTTGSYSAIQSLPAKE